VIGRHLNSPPPPLGHWRPDLADLDPVLGRALAKNRADRYRNCTDFALSLANPRGAVVGAPLAATREFPVTQQAGAYRAEAYPAQPVSRRPERGVSRGWLAAGAVAAVLLIMLAALVIRPWKHDDARPAGTTDVTTSAPWSTTTATSSTKGPVSDISFDAMRDLVLNVYGALPGDPMLAWAKFDPHYQNRAGLQDFLGFWSSAQSVTVLSVTPRDPTSVTVRLRYVMNDGRIDTEDRWLSTVVVDGKLLVYDSERIGAA
jgi:serine/threonine-protein kinase